MKKKFVKFYIVDAEVIESNFPDEFEAGTLTDWEVIYKEAVDPDAKIYELMGHYLSDGEVDFKTILKRLRSCKNDNLSLENIKGISVWEPLEGKYTVRQFRKLLGI